MRNLIHQPKEPQSHCHGLDIVANWIIISAGACHHGDGEDSIQRHTQRMFGKGKTNITQKKKKKFISFFFFVWYPPSGFCCELDGLALHFSLSSVAVCVPLYSAMSPRDPQPNEIDRHTLYPITIVYRNLQLLITWHSIFHSFPGGCIYIHTETWAEIDSLHGGKKRRVCVFIIKRHAAAAASFSLYTHSIQPDDDDNRFFFSFKWVSTISTPPTNPITLGI